MVSPGQRPGSRRGTGPPLCYAHGVASAPFRYQSDDEDSARWLSFRFRPGDIVISTRRRTGTTWMQMICALLIFRRPELPAPLWHLSPWLDHMIVPADRVHDRLDEQPHRRFIKTHTPLDGIPLDPQVTYIVTARHPLDTFVSLRHHLDNIEGARLEDLIGQAAPTGPGEPLRDSLLRWIADDGDPRVYPESLPAVMWHLSGAWARRTEPNVLLVHYDDLRADLEGQMRGIAWRLGIAVPEGAWTALTQAATFEHMRDRSDQLVPSARPAPPPADHPAPPPANRPGSPASRPGTRPTPGAPPHPPAAATPPQPPAAPAQHPAAPPHPPAAPPTPRPPRSASRPPRPGIHPLALPSRGSSWTRPRSSTGAAQGRGARSSATRNWLATTHGPPSWPPRTCSNGCTRRPA